MAKVPRVVLLLYPYAGYDRGILQGIVRYVRLHGPWVFYLAGEDPGLPPAGCRVRQRRRWWKSFRVGQRRWMRLPDLRQWGATGIIGRLQNREITRAGLCLRVRWSSLMISEQQLLPNVSDIDAHSPRAGRLAAEHLLQRGFQHYAYCGYDGRSWSERRRQGFCERLAEAACHVYRPPQHLAPPLLWRQERSQLTSGSHGASQAGRGDGLQRRPRPAGDRGQHAGRDARAR